MKIVASWRALTFAVAYTCRHSETESSFSSGHLRKTKFQQLFAMTDLCTALSLNFSL